MKQSATKIVDSAIVPTLAILVGKFAGIVLISKLLGIELSVRGYSNALLSVDQSVAPLQIQTITSYSDLIMYAVVVGLFSVTLIRVVFLHDSHIKPSLVARLADSNLLSLVQNSYELYHVSSVHLLFLWIATGIIVVNSVVGFTFAWLAIAAVVSSVILTAILLQDVYREIGNIKNNPAAYEWV